MPMSTDADRISVRRQQIEQLQDLIAWEKAHDWGEAGELGPMSSLLIGHYVRAVATLESIEAYLTGRVNASADREHGIVAKDELADNSARRRNSFIAV